MPEEETMPESIREVVKEKYGEAARRVVAGVGNSCCGGAACGTDIDPITRDLYDASQTSILPEQAVKASLGPALMFLDPSSVIAADVALFKNQPGVMRFHLRSLLVNGVAMPEALLSPLMSQVGARYPALTQTGRDILISIPQDGTMRLENGGVRVAISTPAPQPKSKS